MIGKLMRLAPALGAALVLAACSGTGTQQSESLPKVLKESVSAAVKARREGPRPVVTVTPKMLADTKIAALQVNPEKLGGSDFLRRIARRNDSEYGTVEVWSSSDNAQIFLRNGVLVGTRGVGGDIISSAAPATIRAVSQAVSGAGNRLYRVDRGDNTVQDVTLGCRIDSLGPQQIVVVNQAFATIHLRETCTGGPTGETAIVNNYWVQPGSGLVRKSRQWAGPIVGYFEMILLKN